VARSTRVISFEVWRRSKQNMSPEQPCVVSLAHWCCRRPILTPLRVSFVPFPRHPQFSPSCASPPTRTKMPTSTSLSVDRIHGSQSSGTTSALSHRSGRRSHSGGERRSSRAGKRNPARHIKRGGKRPRTGAESKHGAPASGKDQAKGAKTGGSSPSASIHSRRVGGWTSGAHLPAAASWIAPLLAGTPVAPPPATHVRRSASPRALLTPPRPFPPPPFHPLLVHHARTARFVEHGAGNAYVSDRAPFS